MIKGMLRSTSLLAGLFALGLLFVIPAAHAQGLSGGADVGDGGASAGASADVGGVSADVGASVGGGGVGAGASVDVGGTSADVGAGAGGGAAGASASVGFGGATGDASVGIGAGPSAGAELGIDLGGIGGAPGAPGAPGGPGGIGAPGAGLSTGQIAQSVDALSPQERARLARKCKDVLANPGAFSRETVAVCRVVASL